MTKMTPSPETSAAPSPGPSAAPRGDGSAFPPMDLAATDLTSATPAEFALQELERRVHALEEAVARLDDIDALEERVTARMKERLPQAKVAPPPDHDAAG